MSEIRAATNELPFMPPPPPTPKDGRTDIREALLDRVQLTLSEGAPHVGLWLCIVSLGRLGGDSIALKKGPENGPKKGPKRGLKKGPRKINAIESGPEIE